MELTVAICTYNRADSLEDTLAHLCRFHGVEGLAWELLLIDNNCTDQTQAVAVRFGDRLPLRYLVERSQGLSHGRNRARPIFSRRFSVRARRIGTACFSMVSWNRKQSSGV